MKFHLPLNLEGLKKKIISELQGNGNKALRVFNYVKSLFKIGIFIMGFIVASAWVFSHLSSIPNELEELLEI